METTDQTNRLAREVGNILKGFNGRRIMAAALAGKMGLYNQKADTTHYPIRLLIKHAIEALGMPIGSCSKGYYWITNDQDYMLTINDLKARRMGLDKRIKAIHKNYVKEQEKKKPKGQTQLWE